jgi:methionyl-tRNA formyltransferase
LHASLLPKYRGAAPIQRCLLEGETESGVTIMHMVRKMDAGDMIKVAKVPIGPDMTFGELEKALCECGKKALLDVIGDFEKGIVHRTPQDHSQATFAPKIELEDCEIKWNQPARAIHNLIRGVNPYPGAWCYLLVRGEKKRLKITRTCLTDNPSQAEPGTIVSYGKEGLKVAAQDQELRLLEVQLEGKRAMTADEFMRGFSADQLSFILS